MPESNWLLLYKYINTEKASDKVKKTQIYIKQPLMITNIGRHRLYKMHRNVGKRQNVNWDMFDIMKISYKTVILLIVVDRYEMQSSGKPSAW